MDASPLQPRQLEGELSDAAVGAKRRAPTPIQQGTLETGQPHDSSKKPRLPGSAAPAQDGAAEEEEAVPRVDMFDYFAQRAGRQQELQKEVDRLKQRESGLERRLKDADLQLSRLQTEAASAAARQEGREAQLQLQVEQAEGRVRREVERAAALQVQLQKAKAVGAIAASPGASASAGSAAADAEELRQLRVRSMELERQLAAAVDDGAARVRRIDAELAEERLRRQGEAVAAAALLRRVEAAEAQSVVDAAARREAEAATAAVEAAAMQAQASSAGRGSSESDSVIIRSLREQLKTAEAAAADAGRLREQAAAAAALRTKLDAAESRARRAEQLLDSETSAHAELAAKDGQLQRWTAILSGVGDCNCPEDVLRLVCRLQESMVAATAVAGKQGEDLAAVRADAEAAAAAARDAEARAEAAIARSETAETALARMDRRAALLSRERDSLKSVLASYDEEYLSKDVQGGGGEGDGEISAVQRRIAELEATVEALHAHVAALEGELGAGSAAAAGTADAVAEAAARAAVAESRAVAAESEAENLAKQVALLLERVGRGEYNPETTKVLHLRNNPEAELQRAAKDSRIAELEAVNDALRQNIQRLEAAGAVAGGGDQEGGSGGGGDGSALRIAQLEGEANLLRRRVAEVQKSSDRLQQVFTKQIATFRDAMKGLFGYAVEMTSDPAAKDYKAQFVLRPQHADQAGAELAFRMLRDGRIVLVPTEYSQRRLAREVETFVTRYRSIPALTANLTMENFQQNTQA